MRIRLLLSALMILSLTATGCAASSGPTLLSDAAAKASLIPIADLGPGFTTDTSKSKDEQPNCLRSLTRFARARFPREHRSDVRYEADSELHLPSVLSATASFASVAGAASDLSQFRTIAAGCHTIDTTLTGGLHLILQVSVDDKVGTSAAAAQVNVVATGTGTVRGVTLPYTVQIRMIRVANNLAAVGLITIMDLSSADSAELAKIATARLVALGAGDDPPPHDPINLHVVTRSDIDGAQTKVRT